MKGKIGDDIMMIREIEDEQQTKRILGFIGIAKRAGRLVLGKKGMRSYLRKDGKKVIIVANDIGDRIFNDILKKARYGNAVILILKRVGKRKLASAMGKTTVSAVALSSSNMIDGILKLLMDDFRENRGDINGKIESL